MDDETKQSYAAAGFGQVDARFGSRPAVLVVDMCNAYFTEGSPLDLGRPQVVDRTHELVTAARTAGVPVLWTRVEFEPGSDNGVWYERLAVLNTFDAGNPLADWIPGLEPGGDEIVITKQHASGFFGTDLASQLGDLQVDCVLIGGVSTSGCVRATATDCSASGFAPLVVAEATGDRTSHVHESNLFDLSAKYADVIALTDALDYLAQLAG